MSSSHPLYAILPRYRIILYVFYSVLYPVPRPYPSVSYLSSVSADSSGHLLFFIISIHFIYSLHLSISISISISIIHFINPINCYHWILVHPVAPYLRQHQASRHHHVLPDSSASGVSLDATVASFASWISSLKTPGDDENAIRIRHKPNQTPCTREENEGSKAREDC